MTRKPAIFLDRDGILTKEFGYICPIEKVEIFSYVKECIDYIHKKEYYAIVITNQSGVARGIFTEQELHKLNKEMEEALGIDKVYYCPHHLQAAVKRYRIDCNCRKPKTGLFQQACKDYEIDLEKSYMAGDRNTDIQAGINMGLKTVLLNDNYDFEGDVTPDYIFRNLREFVLESGLI